MEIYDFHAHIYPEKIREKAVESFYTDYTITVNCNGSAEYLLQTGKKAGIDKFVTLAVATTGRNVEAVNDFILYEQVAHPEFVAFGSVHPDHPDMCGEIERIKKAGIKGIKLHPSTQKFVVDDERMFPVYDYLSEIGLPLLVHCGDYRFDFDNPERVAHVLDEFPKLRLVAAHLGGWLLYDRALDMFKNRECYLDCSSVFMYTGKRHGLQLIREYGAERIVFGSDYPVWNPEQELKALLELGLTDSELEMILCRNAKDLLGE